MSEILKILDFCAGWIIAGTILYLISIGIPLHDQGDHNWPWPFVAASALAYYPLRKLHQIDRLNQEHDTKLADAIRHEREVQQLLDGKKRDRDYDC